MLIYKGFHPFVQCMKPHTMREGSVTNYDKEQVVRIFYFFNMYILEQKICTY